MLYTVAFGGIGFLLPALEACILLACIELDALDLLVFISFSNLEWMYFNP